MTRRTRAALAAEKAAAAQKIERFPLVNMNDGHARLIIVFEKDIEKGIYSIGRYGVSAGIALSAAVEALPTLRMQELEETGAMMGALAARVQEVSGQVESVVDPTTEPPSFADPEDEEFEERARDAEAEAYAAANNPGDIVLDNG